MTDLFQRLAAPFAPDRVSWRVGSTNGDKTKGMALAYIDARDVMERLDGVCGPDGWQRKHPHVTGTTTCEIGLKVGEEWIWKSDGAGDTDYEAEKGSLSTAFKRAAVNWGIGRYLYDLRTPWVEIEQRGKSFIIKDGEYGKLRNLLDNYGRDLKPPPPVEKPTGGRKSSAQAKRDGDDKKIKDDIANCDLDGLRDWHTRFDEYTATLPFSWLDSVRDMLEHRLEELNAPPNAEADEMDEQFRQTMGGGRAQGLPGDASQVAAE